MRFQSAIFNRIVVVLAPDGSRPVYSAFYSGPKLASIASAVPSPSGIYLANVALAARDRGGKGIQRLPWPPELVGKTSVSEGK